MGNQRIIVLMPRYESRRSTDTSCRDSSAGNDETPLRGNDFSSLLDSAVRALAVRDVNRDNVYLLLRR